jgi:hypothetical protein
MPVGPAAVRAWALAEVARAGEILTLSSLGRSLPWPAGVGAFTAPSTLFAEGAPVSIYRDLR